MLDYIMAIVSGFDSGQKTKQGKDNTWLGKYKLVSGNKQKMTIWFQFPK